MAFTVAKGRRSYTITWDDLSADIDVPKETGFSRGFRLSHVRFTPSAAGDRLVIRGQSSTGPILFDLFVASASDVSRSVGGKSLREKLYIMAADQVFSDPTKAVLVLEYD